MSEVVRNYTWGGSLRKRRRNLRRHSSGVAKFVFPLLVVVLLLCLWLTRDNYARNSFVPADSNIEFYVNDILECRAALIESRVFSLAPELDAAQRAYGIIAGDLPIPEWLLNNLSADLCHVSAPSFERADTAVISVHMTRIGGIAERFIRFSPSIEKDFAGGLRLFHVPDANIYYAVRGRTLIFSPHRASLIRALTLSPAETLDERRFMESVRKAAGTDIFCRIKANALDRADIPFEQMEIALHLQPASVIAETKCRLSRDFVEQYAPFMATLSPREIPVPLDSMITLSADVGVSPRELIKTFSTLFPALEPVAGLFDDDLTPVESITDAQMLFQNALRLAGTSMRFGLFGVEPYEMLPAPLLAATFTADTDTVLALFERIAPVPEETGEVDLAPRLDDDHLLAYVPLIGGPSIEPAVASYGHGLLFSSSAALARDLLHSEQLNQNYLRMGNLYLGIRPLPLVDACFDAAREFAISGLLRGHNEETIEEASQKWRGAVSKLDDIALFVACDNYDVRAELKLSMNNAKRYDAAPAETAEKGLQD